MQKLLVCNSSLNSFADDLFVKISLYWLPGSNTCEIYEPLASATSKQMLFKILVKVFGLELLPKSKTELQGNFKGVSHKRLPIAVHTGEDRCGLIRLRPNLGGGDIFWERCFPYRWCWAFCSMRASLISTICAVVFSQAFREPQLWTDTKLQVFFLWNVSSVCKCVKKRNGGYCFAISRFTSERPWWFQCAGLPRSSNFVLL